MELIDLVGVHYLSGIELCETSYINEFDEAITSSCVRFTIDGVTFDAIEDPDDGYRSYLSGVVESNEEPKYKFKKEKVFCYIEEDEYGAGGEILVFRNFKTGKVILEIGTDRSDSYYPCCVFLYHPENLSANERKDEYG